MGMCGMRLMESKTERETYHIQDEVTTYWEKHFETTSRSILRPEYAANEAVRQPYKWAHLAPSVIDSAIHAIHTQAAPWPRQFYDMGRSTDQRIVNWVLKWLLWHVCRYRDWRNRKNRRDNQDASFHLPAGSTSYAPAMAPSPNLNPASEFCSPLFFSSAGERRS